MRILVTDPIAAEGLDLLREQGYEVDYRPDISPDELLKTVGQYDALIVRGRTKVTREVIEAGENLKVIARAGVGVDNIDVEAATELRIPVVNAPASLTTSVAELTLGHMLSLARYLTQADAGMKAGKWGKKALLGTELKGKTLGLAGIGRIGAEVCRLCQAFGMEVIAYDPYLTAEAISKMGAEKVELDDVLKRADYVSIHVPLNPETEGMIGIEALRRMKPTAYLINCSRGRVVDEDALVRALKEGMIAGAALDAFKDEPPTGSPLLGLENVVLTPHIGGSTEEGQIRASLDAAEGVIAVLSGKRPKYIVNPEALSPEAEG